MASLFSKDPAARPPPTAHEKIAPEISHLKKRSSIRDGKEAGNRWNSFIFLVVICVLVGLYCMDPVLHALYKWEAIRVYLYLHNYGSGSQANALAASGIFSEEEIAVLNRRKDSFQDYFSSPEQAVPKAESIVTYMNSVNDLHAGRYDQLDALGKLRYLLFIRTSIPLPMNWSSLDPAVGD